MSLSFVFGMRSEDRGVQQFSGELIERKTLRRAGLLRLLIQILDGGIKESEDRNGGVFGADFLDDAQALEAPGMEINGQGIPTAGGQYAKEIHRRLGAVDAQGRGGGFRKRVRNSHPGRIFAQEQDLEYGVVHRSFLLLLAE